MNDLIDEITAYCDAKGITPGTFGSYAMNDGKFFRRICAGGECLPRIVQRARDYMMANPPQSQAAAEVGD